MSLMHYPFHMLCRDSNLPVVDFEFSTMDKLVEERQLHCTQKLMTIHGL